MGHTRRQFIKRGVTFVGAGLVAPRVLLHATPSGGVSADTAAAAGRILVVVELQGGNDGLNTVVPYTSSLYRHYRPTVALGQTEVMPITDTMALHGRMGALKALYDENRLAVVQSVGYPDPDRSHFRSSSIWQTANPTGVSSTGWLGRYLDATAATADSPLEAISLGDSGPEALNTLSATAAAVDSLDTYAFDVDEARPQDEENRRRAFLGTNGDLRGTGSTYEFLGRTNLVAYESSLTLRAAAESYVPAVAYPSSGTDPYGFGNRMKLVAQMIGANLGTNVYYVTLGSFDTHANQRAIHANLLRSLSEGLSAFYRDMVAHGLGDDVMVMTFSEFGRRVEENGSKGTDHGAAAPMFVLGNAVKGGVYGADPDLAHLADGDVPRDVDFRSVYATVLANWLQTEPEPILGGSFEDVGFVDAAARSSSRPAAKADPARRARSFDADAARERRVVELFRPTEPAEIVLAR